MPKEWFLIFSHFYSLKDTMATVSIKILIFNFTDQNLEMEIERIRVIQFFCQRLLECPALSLKCKNAFISNQSKL